MVRPAAQAAAPWLFLCNKCSRLLHSPQRKHSAQARPLPPHLTPVVVRASTLATVYAFFSTATAAAWAVSSSTGAPRKKARLEMLFAMRRTVSAR